jgi:hypothetical protein
MAAGVRAICASATKGGVRMLRDREERVGREEMELSVSWDVLVEGEWES